MTDVVNFNAARAERENDNSLLSPVDLLKEVIREIESGECRATSVLILTLYEEAETSTYEPGWYAARMKGTEMIALMECVKATILRAMGFT